MTTLKQRINITADRHVENALRLAARRDRVPLASKAAELLELALNLEEDLALAQLADRRLNRKVKFISHELAWR